MPSDLRQNLDSQFRFSFGDKVVMRPKDIKCVKCGFSWNPDAWTKTLVKFSESTQCKLCKTLMSGLIEGRLN